MIALSLSPLSMMLMFSVRKTFLVMLRKLISIPSLLNISYFNQNKIFKLVICLIVESGVGTQMHLRGDPP